MIATRNNTQFIWKLTTAVATILARKGPKEVMVQINEVDHVRHKELVGRLFPVFNDLRNAALKTNENVLTPHLVEFDQNKNGKDGNLPGLIQKKVRLLIKHWCTPGDNRPLGERFIIEGWAGQAAYDAALLLAEGWREENKGKIEAAKLTVQRMRSEESLTYHLMIPSLGFDEWGNPFQLSFALTRKNIGVYNQTTGKTKIEHKHLPADAKWEILTDGCGMGAISGDKLPVLHEVMFRKNAPGGKPQAPQKPLAAPAAAANGNGAVLDQLAVKLTEQAKPAPAPIAAAEITKADQPTVNKTAKVIRPRKKTIGKIVAMPDQSQGAQVEPLATANAS
jgi:hypothetical protein